MQAPVPDAQGSPPCPPAACVRANSLAAARVTGQLLPTFTLLVASSAQCPLTAHVCCVWQNVTDLLSSKTALPLFQVRPASALVPWLHMPRTRVRALCLCSPRPGARSSLHRAHRHACAVCSAWLCPDAADHRGAFARLPTDTTHVLAPILFTLVYGGHRSRERSFSRLVWPCSARVRAFAPTQAALPA